MRKSFLLLSALVLMFSFVIPVSAESNEATSDGNYSVTLTPSSDSSIVLQSVEYSVEGNKTRIRVGNAYKPTEKGQHYEITVDPGNGTYTAISKSSTIEKGPVSIQTVSNYTATVKATTLDPLDIPCNYTMLQWGWSEDQDLPYPFGFNSRNLTTWDAQPTSAGTNWYFVSYQYNNAPSGTGQSANATHVNHDFLSGALGDTYAEHYISITPEDNGQFHYYVDLTTDGTAGYILHLGVDVL